MWPQDPGFAAALAGGVTTLQILPGSANLFGGRSVVVKNVPARTVQEMKFPGAPHGLKMACGENPKRVYGFERLVAPGTRMGNVAGGAKLNKVRILRHIAASSCGVVLGNIGKARALCSRLCLPLIPAKARIRNCKDRIMSWIPACARMSGE